MMTTGTSPLETSAALRCRCAGSEAVLAAALNADPDRFAANEEPTLDDLLQDPITACLMASDGLHDDTVLAVLHAARARLGAE